MGTLADVVMRGEAATPNAEEENFVVLLMKEDEPGFEHAARASTAPTETKFRNRVRGFKLISLNSTTQKSAQMPCLHAKILFELSTKGEQGMLAWLSRS